MSDLLLRVSLRFARFFDCKLDEQSDREKRPPLLEDWNIDLCAAQGLGGFVLFTEEYSLFNFVVSLGYHRSLAPVLGTFHRRREELAGELGLSALAPVSSTKWSFGKRVNRHIIGSQNDFIHLLRANLHELTPPLEVNQLQRIEDSLNESPMSYLVMNSPRFALVRTYDKGSKSSMARKVKMDEPFSDW